MQEHLAQAINTPHQIYIVYTYSSASTGLLQVPRARTMIGRRSFAVAGPSLWNFLLLYGDQR